MSSKKTTPFPVAQSDEFTAATYDNDSSVNPIVENNGILNNTVSDSNVEIQPNPVFSPNLFGVDKGETESADSTTSSEAPVETSLTEISGLPDSFSKPKQNRISGKQRKLGLEEYKATYLTPIKIVKRHTVVMENGTWEQLERIARILGNRGANVSSMVESICRQHIDTYKDAVAARRKP